MILMPQILDITANENACYKHNELELIFSGFLCCSYAEAHWKNFKIFKKFSYYF